MTEIIAEIGSTHQGEVTTAMRLIEAAAKAGASAVKFQKRSNRHLFTKAYYNAPYNSESSYGATYGEHREHLEFNKMEYRLLKLQAEDQGVKFYCTAFDPESVDFLVDLGVDGIKIASGDLTNSPLLAYAASTGLPMYVSSGAASLEDVQRAVELLRPLSPGFALFQCTAIYPCRAEDLDLHVIPQYKALFPDLRIGFSSHFSGIWPGPVAVALGAEVLELHVTLDRASRGTDHGFSLEPQGLRKLVRDVRRVEAALGTGTKSVRPSELPALTKMAKAIRAARTLPSGTVLSLDDLSIKSPGGDGFPPYRLNEVIGRRLLRECSEDDLILEENLDEARRPHRNGSRVLPSQERR